ncbi:MAG: 30S ribosomal protein S15 [Thermoplasmatota archaeon]
MARMHKSRRGKSSSKRPNITENPEWVEMEKEEIIEKITQLSKRGHSASEIGVILRDQYGVPDVKLATEMDVSEILKEKNLYPDIPEDLMNLMETAVNLHEHLERNPKDLKNKRGLQLVEAKIRRLAKYYKKKDILDEKWKYTLEQAEMLTQ